MKVLKFDNNIWSKDSLIERLKRHSKDIWLDKVENYQTVERKVFWDARPGHEDFNIYLGKSNIDALVKAVEDLYENGKDGDFICLGYWTDPKKEEGFFALLEADPKPEFKEIQVFDVL